MRDRQPRQQAGSGAAAARSAAPSKLTPKALQKAAGANRRQGLTRSSVTGRFTRSESGAGTSSLKSAASSVRLRSAGKKTATSPAPPLGPADSPTPVDKTPVRPKATLTGKSGLVGFLDSGRDDLSIRTKGARRRRDG